MHDPVISIFQNMTTTSPLSSLPISEALENIRSGTFRQYTEHLRKLLADGKEAEYKAEKGQSHALTFGGKFIHRKNNGIVTPSGAVVLDYDGLPSRSAAEALRNRLGADPFVVGAFLSPSALGVKVVVRIQPTTDNEEHKRQYEAVSAYFGKKYGAPKTDKAAKDLARLCFVSYDPDLRSRPYAETVTYVAPTAAPILEPQPTPAPAKIRSSASSPKPPAPAAVTTTTSSSASEADARRHLVNYFAMAKKAKENDPGESRHYWMLGAAKIARQYVLGGISADAMRDALVGEYLTLFPSSEHPRRREDAVRCFNGRQTLDLAQKAGALTPSTTLRSSSPSGIDRPAEEGDDDRQGGPVGKYAMTEDRFRQISTYLAYRPNWNNKPETIAAPLTLNGVPISTVGGITVIAALPGSGKSVVSGAIWAAANGKKDPSTLLGFEVKDGIIAEYIDTEQPRDTHHTTWERAMRRAGYSRGEEPEHVRGRYHSLSRLTDPLELAAYVARMIYEGDADLYIVDGITDLMDDTNDNKESIQIVKLFEEAAAANGVTIVTTIHPNDKANAGTLRGHIGSHLLRKATTALRIDTRPKDEETYHRLWIPPNFKTRFSREPEVWFRWDDVQMMHVTTTAPAEEGRSKTKVMSRDDLIAIYSETGASSFGTNDLTRRIAQKLDVSESTAKKRLTEAKEAGWLADMLGNGTALSLKYD